MGRMLSLHHGYRCMAPTTPPATKGSLHRRSPQRSRSLQHESFGIKDQHVLTGYVRIRRAGRSKRAAVGQLPRQICSFVLMGQSVSMYI